MNSFGAFIVYTIVVIAFFLFMTLFADLIKNRIIRTKEDREKGTPYESGVPFKELSELKIDIKFFKVALIFLLFDVETVYLFPWAYRLEKLGVFALVEGLIFVFILVFAYFYILRERGIEWK